MRGKPALLHGEFGHSLLLGLPYLVRLGRRRRRLLPQNEATQGGQEEQEGQQQEHRLPFLSFVFPLPGKEAGIHHTVFRYTAASLLPPPPPRIQHLASASIARSPVLFSVHLRSFRNFFSTDCKTQIKSKNSEGSPRLTTEGLRHPYAPILATPEIGDGDRRDRVKSFGGLIPLRGQEAPSPPWSLGHLLWVSSYLRFSACLIVHEVEIRYATLFVSQFQICFL